MFGVDGEVESLLLLDPRNTERQGATLYLLPSRTILQYSRHKTLLD